MHYVLWRGIQCFIVTLLCLLYIVLTHRTSVEDIKREHEQDKHHLVSMHRQEMEALKAAHSHTRYIVDTDDIKRNFSTIVKVYMHVHVHVALNL